MAIQSIVSLFALALAATASPISSQLAGRAADNHATTPETPAANSVWQPEMYNVYPESPDLCKPPVTHLHVEAYQEKSQLEQVAIFRGIPAEARVCTLMWSQAVKEDRVFVTKGQSAHTRVTQLSGLPAEGPITFSSIQPFDVAPEEESVGPDFTFWDDAGFGQSDHNAGIINCAEEIYLKVSMRNSTATATLFMEQDAQNGFWIEWEL